MRNDPPERTVAVVLPLMISMFAILSTIVIHALAAVGIFHFVRRQHQLGHTGIRFWRDVAIVSGATLLVRVAHLVDAIIWAMVFTLYGEFRRLAPAFYSSATLYSSLGYEATVMSTSWRCLGPFETADGLLMLGLSTAMAISVIQLVIRTRFYDLPNF
jgi:hypothetical protein